MEKIFVIKSNDDLKLLNKELENGGKVKLMAPVARQTNIRDDISDVYLYVVVVYDC